MKPRQIRIFSAGGLLAVGFFRLALDAAGFFLALLHLFRFFTVTFGERCFSWLSDGVLLVGVEWSVVYTNAGLHGEGKMTECFLEPIKRSSVTVKETDNGLRTLSDHANYDKTQRSGRLFKGWYGGKDLSCRFG